MIGFTNIHGWDKNNGNNGDRPPNVRRLVAVGLALATLGIVRSITYAESTDRGSQPNLQTMTPPDTNLGETSNGLKVGNKITPNNLLIPKDGKFRQIILSPKPNQAPQNVKIIYSSEVSQSVLSNSGDPDKNDVVGFLLTQGNQTIDMSLVIFDSKTEVVKVITQGSPIKQNFQLLFEYINPVTNAGAEVYIEPIDNNQNVLVTFNGVSVQGNTAPNGTMMV